MAESGVPPLTALIVDDDANFRRILEVLVQREGFTTRVASSLADARLKLAAETPDVVLMDLKLPDGDGLEWLRSEEGRGRCEVIVITGGATIDSAIDATRGGALDYLTKPIDGARLTHRAPERGAHARPEEGGREPAQRPARPGSLRPHGRALEGDAGDLRPDRARRPDRRDAYSSRARAAPARSWSRRPSTSSVRAGTVRFCRVNCGAISPSLIESELFGHERGSFTGADKQRKGYFERANGGTLFLDEVSEMPHDLQVKLLRVLETGTVVRVGGSAPIRVDVRIIAATNRNPEEAVRSGQLREDLYYRLNVFPIAVPPLRTRPDDVEALALHFLAELNQGAAVVKRWTAASARTPEAEPVARERARAPQRRAASVHPRRRRDHGGDAAGRRRRRRSSRRRARSCNSDSAARSRRRSGA